MSIRFEEFFELFNDVIIEPSTPQTIKRLTLPQFKILWYLSWIEELSTKMTGYYVFRKVYKNKTVRGDVARAHLRCLQRKGLLRSEKDGRFCVWSLSDRAKNIIDGKGGFGA